MNTPDCYVTGSHDCMSCFKSTYQVRYVALQGASALVVLLQLQAVMEDIVAFSN